MQPEDQSIIIPSALLWLVKNTKTFT